MLVSESSDSFLHVLKLLIQFYAHRTRRQLEGNQLLKVGNFSYFLFPSIKPMVNTSNENQIGKEQKFTSIILLCKTGLISFGTL